MFQLFHENSEQQLSFLDKLEIEVFKDCLTEKTSDFNHFVAAYEQQNFGSPVLIKNFFHDLFADVLQEGFYGLFYRQAIALLEKDVSQKSALQFLEQIRFQTLVYANDLDSPALVSALTNLFQIGTHRVSMVYDIAQALEQVKQRSYSELRRLKNLYQLIGHNLSEDIFNVCMDHQKWKELTFELALGRKVDLGGFEPSHLKCKVAEWLSAGGAEMIPERDIRLFKQAHEKVHLLGMMAIDASRNNRAKDIVSLLYEMERNSQIVMDVLLDLLERELVGNAYDDDLKGFLNGNLLEIELERSSAFAKRHDFWLDMIVVGLGAHQDSKIVMHHIAKAIKLIARTEDMLFFVEEQGIFVILSLGKETEGAHVFANRVFQSIEHNRITLEDEHSIKLDIPCGALSYWAGLGLPEQEVMQALMHQLKLAEDSPKASVKYTILDVIKPEQIRDDEKLF